MTQALLTLAWFLGITWGSCRFLRIPFPDSPLFSISLSGVILTLAGISGCLEAGARGLHFLGWGLAVLYLVSLWRNPGEPALPWRQAVVLAGTLLFCFILTLGMRFTVDDDYVYWGILPRYLAFFNHLPDPDTTIIRQHLAYTPGTSLIHYLVFRTTGSYGISLSYFAQTLILIAPLFSIFARESLKKGTLLTGLVVLILVGFFGSVFTKLQVDYLLAVWFYVMLWIVYTQGLSPGTVARLGLPVCFLFLIKEIGLFLAVLVLLIMTAQLLFERNRTGKDRAAALALVCFTGLGLWGIKQLWVGHCEAMGFGAFGGRMGLTEIRAAFNFAADPAMREAGLLFLKTLILGEADRLNLPYVCWYLALGFGALRLWTGETALRQRRLGRGLGVCLFGLALYLVMIYLLQVTVFKVGVRNHHIIGFERYMNILFVPLVLFILTALAERRLSRRPPSARITAVFFGVVLLVLGASRLETSLKREPWYDIADTLAGKIHAAADMSGGPAVAVVPGKKDHYLGLRMTCLLLPGRVNRGTFPASDRQGFFQALSAYEYVIVHRPDARMLAWLRPVMDEPFDTIGFYRVEKASNGGDQGALADKSSLPNTIRLIKLFDWRPES